MAGLEFYPRLNLSRKTKNLYVKKVKLSHKLPQFVRGTQ